MTAAQAHCSFKVVFFMLAPAFLVPEDDLPLPISIWFSSSVLPECSECGILTQRENVKTPLTKLCHIYTRKKKGREVKDGRDRFDQEEIMRLYGDLQVLSLWSLLASSCPFAFLAVFTFCFENGRLFLSI